MASLSEGKHTGEFILSEANGDRSRENIIVLSGENLKAGHVVARRLISPTVGAAVALGTNTGNGTVTGVSAGNAAQRGTYRVVFTEPATNLGTFSVIDPAGRVIGDGVVGTGFTGEINFTINDGATDFVAGDAFTFAVTGGTYKYREYNPANTDGTQNPDGLGVLYDNVDAATVAADKPGVAFVRQCEVRSADLTWFTGATTTQKETATDALAKNGVILRS